MAASAKHFSLLFFLGLFSSLHAQARDSQFFSKVATPATNNPAIANPKETVEVPNKEQPLSKQEQAPNFIADTQNGYGLYGQESNQLPLTTATTTNPASTTTNLPYKAESEQPFYYYDKQAYVTNPQGMSDTRWNNNYYYNNNNNNKQAYVNNRQGMSDTRFMDRGYTTNTNNNDNNYYTERGYTTATTATDYYNGGNNDNPEKQGMSDTRFLENGRYFYDVKSENNYNNNGYGSARGVDNYKGYYGNNYNDNSYVENDSMEGYQNQEEFQEGQEEYVP